MIRLSIAACALFALAFPASAQTQFHVPLLEGAQENPPVTTDAMGWAVLTLNPDSTLTYDVRVCSLTGTMAHIHDGPVGVNGPIVFPLSGGPTTWSGTTVALTAGEIAKLRAGDYYVNVHTAVNPSGEVRGQIVPMTGYAALLAGDQEVPPVATAASGRATFDANPDGSITYSVVTLGITGTAAHIHAAPAGSNGGIVFPLTGGPSVWSGTTAVMTAGEFDTLQSEGFYVNVHSAANPGGEIRGQLVTAPRSYGAECGRTGATLAMTGPSFSGDSVEITITGGKPGGTGFLAVTTSPGAIVIRMCCILVTPPTVKEKTITLDGSGARTVTGPIPVIPGGTDFYVQYIGFDNTAPNGQFYSTNAVHLPVHDQ